MGCNGIGTHMRGFRAVFLCFLLGVPSALAATQVHPFRAETGACAMPTRECSIEHNGALQIECQGASCFFTLSIAATYQASLAQTSKQVHAWGRDWNGAESQDACRVRGSALTLRCSGLVTQTILLPNASPCRIYDVISEALEQPLNTGTLSPVSDIGFRSTSVSSIEVCRNGQGVVSVRDA